MGMDEQMKGAVGWAEAGETACGARIWRPADGGQPVPLAKGGKGPLILYFNDAHGALEPLLKRLPAWQASANQAGSSWLTLSGGDEHGGGSRRDASLYGGTFFSRAHRDLLTAKVDLAVPGNHDLDWGWEDYQRIVECTPGLPRVLSHLRSDSPLRETHPEVVVVEFAQHVMAIFGLLCLHQTREAWRHLADPRGVFESRLLSLREQVDSVVVLSHLGAKAPEGFPSDRDLKEILPPDVLILGAHTHDVVPSPGAEREGTYLQCGEKGRYLGSARRKGKAWMLRVEELKEDSPPRKGFGPDKGSHQGQARLSWNFHSDERPAIDGYRGECALINGLTDLLLEEEECDPPTIAALCVRFFPATITEGILGLEDWYSYFGYGDCLAEIRIPMGRIPALLAVNARRLELPAHYLEERGMLHFSGNLRYRLRLRGKEPEVTEILLNGRTMAKIGQTSEAECRLLTHGYVAEGMGGYGEVFEEADIGWRRESVRYLGGSVRDILWEKLLAEAPERMPGLFGKDHRLQFEAESNPPTS